MAEQWRKHHQGSRYQQRRFDAGGVSRADVLQQQATLQATLATLPTLRSQLAQNRNLLAAYLGALPADFAARLNSILTPGATLFVTNEALYPQTSGPMVQVVDADPPAKTRPVHSPRS